MNVIRTTSAIHRQKMMSRRKCSARIMICFTESSGVMSVSYSVLHIHSHTHTKTTENMNGSTISKLTNYFVNNRSTMIDGYAQN